MNRTIAFAWIITLVVSVASNASAQTIEGPAYAFPLTDNVQPLIYGNLFSKSYLEKRRAGKSTARKQAEYYARESKSTRETVSSSDVDFSVDYDKRVSKAVLDSYIDSIARDVGSQAAQGLGRYYGQNDVHQLFAKAISPYGLRGDDLSDVTTAYIVVMWMTANDQALPSNAHVQGVRDQVRDLLLTGGRVPTRNEERQRAAEALIYETVTLIRVREEAQKQGNRAYLAQLADSAQASMQKQKFDLRGLELTEYGLVQR
jgi:hypothetical protein